MPWSSEASRLTLSGLNGPTVISPRPSIFLCTPVRLVYGLFFGGNDAHIGLYFIACAVYMAGLGYALGHFLYKGVSKARRRRLQA